MGSGKQENLLNFKMKLSFIPFCLFLFSTSCFINDRNPSFSFTETTQGVELSDDGQPVFFYQREQKTLGENYVCANYLHPLYSLEGDTLTEESPADHLYHRGVFWGWHQMYIDDQSIGNGWLMQNISQEVVEIKTSIQDKKARFDLDVHWKSSAWQNGKPYVHEQTTILVHPLKEVRIIDFEIRLKGLVPGVSIGGADDEKGYGGLCLRIKTPPDLVFTSVDGRVSPQNLQISAGPWMDFSGAFNINGEKSGLTLMSHPTVPNYPPNWILRQTRSMQNIVYPGRERVEIPVDKPVILRYRLIIHKGTENDVDIPGLKAEYDKLSFQN